MKFRAYSCLLMAVAMTIAAASACKTSQPETANRSNANAGTNANASQSRAQSNSAQGKEPAPSKTRGAIEVTSVPAGARVLLISTDEGGAGEPQPKGLTPATITDLAPGKYTVDLEMTGYRFFQKEVTVKAGATSKVSAALKKH